MSIRTELLEKEAVYEDALKILEKTKPEPFHYPLKNMAAAFVGMRSFTRQKTKQKSLSGTAQSSLAFMRDHRCSLLYRQSTVKEAKNAKLV